MIRMVKAGRLADGVVGALGWEPEAYTLSGKDRNTLADAMNDAIMIAYDKQKWPQLMRTEQRTYRPPWDAATAYLRGHEVWLEDITEPEGGAYYKLLAATSVGEDPLTADVTVWERVTEILPFIQLAQPWERWAIDEKGFDCKNFAWELDPRGDPDLQPIAGARVHMDSVMLPKGKVPARVWIRFVPDRPRLDFTEWVTGTTYAAGEVLYRTAQGRCYVSLIDANTGNVPETSPEEWSEVAVPEFVAKYVRLYAQGVWLTDDQGAKRARTEAAEELARMERAYFEGQGVNEGVTFSCGR